MPVNRGSHISALIEEVKHLNPQSILDVGCGFGMMGTIFRAYTDVRLSELDSRRYHLWATRIDGIEIFEAYRNPAWEMYNTVYVDDALIALDKLGEYDLIYCGDMIEHLERASGWALLNKMLDHATQVIIATPSPAPTQHMLLDNVHEAHVSSWDAKDFEDFVKDFNDKANAEVLSVQIVGTYNGILMVKISWVS